MKLRDKQKMIDNDPNFHSKELRKELLSSNKDVAKNALELINQLGLILIQSLEYKQCEPLLSELTGRLVVLEMFEDMLR
jgi:hypothetical protein